MVRGRPRKFNQNPVLDFRSITDNAWYTVDRLVFCKKNNTLTVRFMGFDNKDDDEELSVEDFKTLKELDEFVDRFRPACVQLQDGECYDMRRGSYVCAVFDPSEENHKFYNAVIESSFHGGGGGLTYGLIQLNVIEPVEFSRLNVNLTDAKEEKRVVLVYMWLGG
ncbi:hypothetical protein C5167_031080 [Papaver somniferum]|nr:hypothetical protein C5167_031080 [Papaver somniferum]